MLSIKKYYEKRKLVEFLKRLEQPNIPYPAGYIESQKNKIELIKWLIASYEGRAGSAKDYLEALLNYSRSSWNYDDYLREMKWFYIVPRTEAEWVKDALNDIKFLYHWVYYKKITGF